MSAHNMKVGLALVVEAVTDEDLKYQRARITRLIEDALIPLQAEGVYLNALVVGFEDKGKVHGTPVAAASV